MTSVNIGTRDKALMGTLLAAVMLNVLIISLAKGSDGGTWTFAVVLQVFAAMLAMYVVWRFVKAHRLSSGEAHVSDDAIDNEAESAPESMLASNDPAAGKGGGDEKGGGSWWRGLFKMKKAAPKPRAMSGQEQVDAGVVMGYNDDAADGPPDYGCANPDDEPRLDGFFKRRERAKVFKYCKKNAKNRVGNPSPEGYVTAVSTD